MNNYTCGSFCHDAYYTAEHIVTFYLAASLVWYLMFTYSCVNASTFVYFCLAFFGHYYTTVVYRLLLVNVQKTIPILDFVSI